jgi:diguanylate cyclase (GGDEF)-like protein/PAS domain S-box-containing protein
MDFKRLRQTITIATICIASIIAICFPAAYAFDVLARHYERIEAVAQATAADASAQAFGAYKDAFWMPRNLLVDVALFEGAWIEVEDAQGAKIYAPVAQVSWPALHVELPIVRYDAVVGKVRVALSIRPLLPRLAAAVLVCALLALLVNLVMRAMTLTPLRQALEQLAAANTELEAGNAQLRKQADMLTEAQEIGKIAYWTFSEAEKSFTWSPAMYKLLGRSPETFELKPWSLDDIGVGDAYARAREVHRKALERGTVETVDIRLVRGDGTIGCFSMTCKPLVDANGARIGLEGTLQDITDRAHAEARLQQLAHYDPLTGLPNRGVVNEALRRALAETEANGGLSALLLIDLDNFKDVNDTLGHAAGDELLVAVVDRITDVLNSDDFFARLGGDEFAVLLKNVTTEQDIQGAALRVLAAVSGDVELEAGIVTVGTSIGIAVVGRDGRTPDDVMRNADLALYRSKSNGRATVSFFEPSLDEELQNKASLARDLRHSLVEDTGLQLHYQPQVDLVTGRVVAFEALLRWTHPQRGAVSPAEFIPIAESSRLICDLGRWVLNKAVRQAATWLIEGGPERQIAINVSPAQILHADILSEVDQALSETGLPPHLLCIELTESLMTNPDDSRVRSVLSGLKARGVSLALDDFGTGYSSLGHLSELPFDKIKIDRTFVSGLAGSPHAHELLKGIITLGRGLRMKVLVEGTESEREIRTVCDFAADYAQGFGIARPVPADDAIAFARACDANMICEDLLDIIDTKARAAA